MFGLDPTQALVLVLRLGL